MVSGLGAATVDAIYGGIAAFGLASISDLLKNQQTWLRLLGGVFLCVLGTRTIRSKPPKHAAVPRRIGLIGAYTSTLLLTLMNPITVFSLGFAYAGLSVAGAGLDYGSATVLVLGVFSGSTIWWLVLSQSVSLLREKLTPKRLRWMDRISGMAIAGLGIIALSSLAFQQIIQNP
jgi:threonine/homoserine/homoserine lactone efflux protein